MIDIVGGFVAVMVVFDAVVAVVLVDFLVLISVMVPVIVRDRPCH